MSRPQLPFRARAAMKQAGNPQVTFRRAGCCTKTLLSAWSTPDGWQILGANFREPPAEWTDRTGVGEDTLAAHFARASYIANLRKVRGFHALMPMSLDEWPTDGSAVEVGCDHSTSHLPLIDIRDACREFRATHKSVSKPVRP